MLPEEGKVCVRRRSDRWRPWCPHLLQCSRFAPSPIGGSVWLTQLEIAELFDTSVSNINKHIKAILDEDEQPAATIEHYSIVQTEGARSVTRQIAHYSLPMILAVGFRVRSPRGAQFRR